MTRAQIEARIAQLRRAQTAMYEERRKLDLDIAATDGGIQDCEHWLTQIDEIDDVPLGSSRTDGS